MAIYKQGVEEFNADEITSGTVPLARLSGITTDQLDAAAGLLLDQMENAVCSETEAGTIADEKKRKAMALSMALGVEVG